MRNMMITAGLVSMLALGGCDRSKVLQNKDLTGDGILDVLVFEEGNTLGMEDTDEETTGNLLYIGKEDGTFTKARLKRASGIGKYFLTGEGRAYVFDGEFYKLHKRNE